MKKSKTRIKFRNYYFIFVVVFQFFSGSADASEEKFNMGRNDQKLTEGEKGDMDKLLEFVEVIASMGDSSRLLKLVQANPAEHILTKKEIEFSRKGHTVNYATGSLLVIELNLFHEKNTELKIGEKFDWVIRAPQFVSDKRGSNIEEKKSSRITAHPVFTKIPGPHYAVIAFKPGEIKLPDSIETVVSVPKDWHDWIADAFTGYAALEKKEAKDWLAVWQDPKSSPFLRAAVWRHFVAEKAELRLVLEHLSRATLPADKPWATALVLGAVATDLPEAARPEFAKQFDQQVQELLARDSKVNRQLYECVIAMGAGYYDAYAENPVTFKYRGDIVEAEFFRRRMVAVLDHVAATPEAQLSEWGKALKKVAGPESAYHKDLVKAKEEKDAASKKEWEEWKKAREKEREASRPTPAQLTEQRRQREAKEKRRKAQDAAEKALQRNPNELRESDLP